MKYDFTEMENMILKEYGSPTELSNELKDAALKLSMPDNDMIFTMQRFIVGVCDILNTIKERSHEQPD